MSDPRTLAGFSAPVLLFLKATRKKQVFIPTYTRHDGSTVQGHYAMVHVADDHDEGRVAGGKGTHSQQKAHATLARHTWFHALPTSHRAAVVMEHATEIQDKASAAASLSTLKKNVLAGKKPTPRELSALEAAGSDKQGEIAAALRAAGKADVLPEKFRDMVAPEKKAKPAPQTKVDDAGAKFLPEGASDLDAHLHAIDSAKLPDSNVNARTVNAKLDAIAAALRHGDVDGLTMMAYGSNNYGVKAAKFANRALELLGSSERVAPGKKATPGFRTDAQIAAAKQAAKAQRSVDPERDSLMTAIAKLGGLKDADVQSQWGISKNDRRGVRVGILPVFSSRGKSIEQMTEALHELGYLRSEEHNELAEHVEHGLAGGDHFTPQGFANKAQEMHEAHYQGLTHHDVAESGFEDLPPEAQQQIEEFLDENPDLSADEIEAIERMQRMAEADDDIPGFDFGPEEGSDGDFGEAPARTRSSTDEVPF